MIVCFRYADLLNTARLRPRDYLETVLRIGWRRGPEVCMSDDAYRHLCLLYAPKIVATPTDAAPTPPRLPVDSCCH